MFKVEQLSKIFKVGLFEKDFKALDQVSFEVRPGSATGFLGANGAGKTTLVKILLGLISPTSGEIIFHQKLGGSRSSALKKTGYIPERPYYYPHLSGRDFLFYMGRLSRLKIAQIEKVIETYGERLGIAFALDREIKGYSKGMLQRLGFLSALLHNPDFLIFDEPLSGLDPVGRRDLKEVMRELVKEGKTLFVSSHIIPDIEELCHDVVVLEKGKLLYQGGIAALLDKSSGSKFEVVYVEQESKEEILECQESELNFKLTELISRGARISHVRPIRARLEDIIYKI